MLIIHALYMSWHRQKPNLSVGGKAEAGSVRKKLSTNLPPRNNYRRLGKKKSQLTNANKILINAKYILGNKTHETSSLKVIFFKIQTTPWPPIPPSYLIPDLMNK